MKNTLLILFLLFIPLSGLLSQTPIPPKTVVFDDNYLSRFDISIENDSLTAVYGDVWSDHEYPVDVEHTFETGSENLTDVGFRLRGNTSRTAEKKSFKIAVNSFQSGRNYHGLEKLNLNGEHNDPTVARSKTAWDIFRDFKVVGSRAAHAQVYINNVYYGLCLNVEHIDDKFVELRYGSQSGNLYKCTWPADLTYIGSNQDDYKPGGLFEYELKTNKAADDYSGLVHFLDVLNNTSNTSFMQEIEKVFNVNQFLKYYAVAVFIGHWDGYAYNKNNFYLYDNPNTGKFEFIPYDLDNTFGIDWMGIDWANRDIYNWADDYGERPLVKRLLAQSTYRDRFSYYMNQLLDSIVDPTIILPKIDALKDKIYNAANLDPYRSLDYGWDISDFNNSYTQALSTTQTPIGLKPYISARYNSAKLQLTVNDIAPIISYVNNNLPVAGEDINVTCNIEDEQILSDVTIFYNIDGGTEQSLAMQSTGIGGINYIGGLKYNALIQSPSDAGIVSYYIEATDSKGFKTREPISGYYEVRVSSTEKPPLVINEFMASNSTIADNLGQFPDWIEIYNAGSEAIYLGDKYLSDDFLDRQRWQMPDMNIQAGEFLVFWASGSVGNGTMHTNFKLSAGGEEIAIFNNENTGYAFIDSVSYGTQTAEVSTGRYPDGTGGFVIMGTPTPAASNINTAIDELVSDKIDFNFYPNPFQKQLNVSANGNYNGEINIEVLTLDGKIAYQKRMAISQNMKGEIELSNLSSGNYLIRILNSSKSKLLGQGKLVKF